MSNPRHVRRVQPGLGQESVWDYPRPPRLEPSSRFIEVWFNGEKIADSHRTWRVLETSHPSVFYIPPEDIRQHALRRTERTTLCEWKGTATYYDVLAGDRLASNTAWAYLNPTIAFAAITGQVAFYPALMDEYRVDGVLVEPQPGDFYGGWLTPEIVGPFKGEPDTWDW